MLLNKVHNSDEIDNINRPISIKEIEFSVKNLPRRKLQAQMASLVESFNYSKRNNTYYTQTLPEKREHFPTHSMRLQQSSNQDSGI